ncbi:hypothetical protein ACU8KH_05075 [Lachancea thermotolerans]
MPSRMFVDGDVEFWFFRLRPRNVQFAGMECQFVDGPSCYCQASVWISVRKCGTLVYMAQVRDGNSTRKPVAMDNGGRQSQSRIASSISYKDSLNDRSPFK